MIFSTASSTERKAGNARLPADGFLTGDERADMDFDFGYGTAKFCLKPVPTVFITFVNLPGVHAFAASDVIDAAKQSKAFCVAPLWNDQPFMSINVEKLKEVAAWIESQTKGQGRFVTVWVPTDTSTPF